MSVIEERWNEAEAIRLMQHTGAQVANLEAGGAKMVQRELYHACIVAAHDAQDMDAYRTALNGYVEAARAAVRHEDLLRRRAKRDKEKE